ncbi:MAG: hypothetical protein ACI8TX_000860 [Hyphomicrobiaceae bacterium]|jgi:hypothetical protein
MTIKERLAALEQDNSGLRNSLARQRRGIVALTALSAALWITAAGGSGGEFHDVVKARRFEVVGGVGEGFPVIVLGASDDGQGEIRISNAAGYNLFRAAEEAGGTRLEIGDGTGAVTFAAGTDRDGETRVALSDTSGRDALVLAASGSRSGLVLRGEDGHDRLILSARPDASLEIVGHEGSAALGLHAAPSGEGVVFVSDEAGSRILQIGGYGRARRRIAAYSGGGGMIASWPSVRGAVGDAATDAVGNPSDLGDEPSDHAREDATGVTE